MAGFRFASGHLPKNPTKGSRATCDRCGMVYRRHELKKESIGAKGSPDDRWSGLLVCPDCFDPIHPLSKLPYAIQQKLPDAEAIYLPRPDNYDIAYPVLFTTPGAIYKPNPLTVTHGLTYDLIANGVFASNGSPFTAIGDSNITFNNVNYVNVQTVRVNITVSGLSVLGLDNNLYIVDGSGNNLRAQLIIN